MNISDSLSRAELFVYIFSWIASNLFVIYNYYTAQSGKYFWFFSWLASNLFVIYNYYIAQSELYDKEEIHKLPFMDSGWDFIGRPKDNSDYEWITWKFFINNSWLYLIIHTILSEFTRRNHPHFLKYWYITGSLSYLLLSLGTLEVLTIVFQPIVYLGIIFAGGQKITVWISSVLLLYLCDLCRESSFIWNNVSPDISFEQVNMLLYGFAWITLRCISFCSDYIDRYHKGHRSSKLEEAIDMLSYILYLPVLFHGPVILHGEFKKSFTERNGNLRSKIKRFLMDIFKYQMYTLAMDLSFHYIYFLGMTNHVELLKRLPSFALCGTIIYTAAQFHMKYLVMYGTTSAFARLDNIDAPPQPRCLLRIHDSQVWRHFDVGLYRFLVKYIHKPVLKHISSKYCLNNCVNKMISGIITFTFIYIWHGMFWKIFYWSLVNYFCYMAEHVCFYFSKSDIYKRFKNKISKSMEARFIGLLNVPLYFTSTAAHFYFLTHVQDVNVYFVIFKNPSPLMFFLFCYSCYCMCHVSMALSNYPSKKGLKSA